MLIVEDDDELRAVLSRGLGEEGFTVDAVSTGSALLERAEQDVPDVLVIDVGLPDADGRDLCQALRARGVDAPVLFLTARDAVVDRVAGFDAGGDDYLTKPFAFAELLARIEALLRRRPSAAESTVLRVADLEFDLIARRVTRGGREIELTAREQKLLEFLMRREGQVVTRTMLLEGVWDLHFDPQSNLVDVHISRLRQAIDRGADRFLIHTVRGSGYVLREEEE